MLKMTLDKRNDLQRGKMWDLQPRRINSFGGGGVGGKGVEYDGLYQEGSSTVLKYRGRK